MCWYKRVLTKIFVVNTSKIKIPEKELKYNISLYQ